MVIIFPEISPVGSWCGSFGFITGTCLVHIRARVSLYQTHTNKCTLVLLNHHLVNAVCNFNVLQPLKGHLQ
jgi:hypothetical protein